MLPQRMRVRKKHRQGSGRFLDCFHVWGFVCVFFWYDVYLCCSERALFNVNQGIIITNEKSEHRK